VSFHASPSAVHSSRVRLVDAARLGTTVACTTVIPRAARLGLSAPVSHPLGFVQLFSPLLTTTFLFLCTGAPVGCADPGSVECPASIGGCCPVGQLCYRDSTNTPLCDSSGLFSTSGINTNAPPSTNYAPPNVTITPPTVTYTPPAVTYEGPIITSTPLPDSTFGNIAGTNGLVTTTVKAGARKSVQVGAGMVTLVISAVVVLAWSRQIEALQEFTNVNRTKDNLTLPIPTSFLLSFRLLALIPSSSRAPVSRTALRSLSPVAPISYKFITTISCNCLERRFVTIGVIT